MIEYLSEIPLPGRMLAPPAAQTGTRSPKSTSFGFIAGAENRLVASAINRLMQPATGATTPKLLALFGHSGTGKTHLAHGLVNHWNTHHGAESAALPHRRRLLSRPARRHQTTYHDRVPSRTSRPRTARHRRPPPTTERRLRIARTAVHARRLRRKRRHNHRHVAPAGQHTRKHFARPAQPPVSGPLAATRTARWRRPHPHHSPSIRVARPSTLRASRRESCQRRRWHGERSIRCRFRTLCIDERRPKRSIAIRPPAATSRNHRRRRPPLPPAAKAAKKPIPPPIDRHRPGSRHLPGPRVGRRQLRTNRPSPRRPRSHDHHPQLPQNRTRTLARSSRPRGDRRANPNHPQSVTRTC